MALSGHGIARAAYSLALPAGMPRSAFSCAFQAELFRYLWSTKNGSRRSHSRTTRNDQAAGGT